MSLRTVFYHQQTVFTGRTAYLIHPAHPAIEMHHHDRFCAHRNQILHFPGIYVASIPFRLTKHRSESGTHDRQYGSYVGICRHDDFVSYLHPPHTDISHKDKRKGIQSVPRSHAIPGPAIMSKPLLESLHLFPEQIPSGTYYPCYSLRQFRFERIIDFL